MKYTIPPKDRQEWIEMLEGSESYTYSNYALQTRIHQLRKDLARNKKTKTQALDELYNLCEKYAIAVQTDFQIIFKSW